jgi:hypothetical protein
MVPGNFFFFSLVIFHCIIFSISFFFALIPHSILSGTEFFVMVFLLEFWIWSVGVLFYYGYVLIILGGSLSSGFCISSGLGKLAACKVVD